MSRIYSNKPLENLALRLHTAQWEGNLEEELTQKSKDKPGALCEGTIISQARVSFSNPRNGTASKARYYLLNLNIVKAHRRKFDAEGFEIEPNYDKTTKVSMGYLNSSYDVRVKGKTDKLTKEEVKSLIENPKFSAAVKDILSKYPEGDLTLLMKEEDHNKIDLYNGILVRVKTAGDNPFLENLVACDDRTSTTGNFVGDGKVGGNWTDKIMSVKSSLRDSQINQEAIEIGDDEWDD